MGRIMRLWIKVASILAKEAIYRFTKERRGAKIFTNPLATNLIALLIYTFLSLATSFYTVYTGAYLYNPDQVAAINTMLIAVALFVSILIMMYNLHILVTDRLIDQLTYLPISTSDMKKALLTLNMYWGIFTIPFLFIPGAILHTIYSKNVAYLIAAIETSIFTTLATLILGFLAASFSPRVTRSPYIRLASTILWLIFMGLGIFVSGLGKYIFENNIEVGITPSETWIRAIPPFSLTYQIYGDIAAIYTSMIVIIALIPLLNASINRFWGSIFRTPKIMPIYETGKVTLKRPRIPIWLYIDIKALARHPRFLASTIYILGFPILMPLFIGFTTRMIISEIIPSFTMAMGAFSGVLVTNLFVIEGDGAKLLYLLPITRKDVVLNKSVNTLFLSGVASIGLVIFISIITELGLPYLILTAFIYMMSAFSSSLFISIAYIDHIPDKPSPWTQYTFSGLDINIKIMGLMMIYTILAGGIAIPQLLKIFVDNGFIRLKIPSILIHPLFPYASAIAILTILTLIGYALAFRRDTPL